LAEKPSLREASCCRVEGGERRVGVAPNGLFLDRSDSECPALDGGLDGVGAWPVLDVELAELGAGDGGEPGANLLAPGRGEQGLDTPVLFGLEGLDLGLAVADEAQGHRLHPAGRAGARQLAPQHRREREADEVVEARRAR
jgi:hypothetical protein